jgi:hypothetical protein
VIGRKHTEVIGDAGLISIKPHRAQSNLIKPDQTRFLVFLKAIIGWPLPAISQKVPNAT